MLQNKQRTLKAERASSYGFQGPNSGHPAPISVANQPHPPSPLLPIAQQNTNKPAWGQAMRPVQA